HYLQEAPDAVDRKAIEVRIAALRQQAQDEEALRRAKERASEAPPAPPPPPPRAAEPPPQSTTPTILPWIVGGVGLAAIGTGAVFGAISRSKNDDARSEPVQTTAADDLDSARRDAVYANVGFVAGAVLVVVAGVWLTLQASSSGSSSAGR